MAWFDDISNPESIIAIVTAGATVVGTVGAVFIDLYKKWKAGKINAYEAFERGITFAFKKVKELEPKEESKQQNKIQESELTTRKRPRVRTKKEK